LGHYWDSPEVSSDVLATLLYDLPPAERGLVQEAETLVWTFPPDYLTKLFAAVSDAWPKLGPRSSPAP